MSDFRKEDNRAHAKKSVKDKVHVSHYVGGGYPGKTLYAYICPMTGNVKGLTIFIGHFSEGVKMPINIEVGKSRGRLEMDRELTIGTNELDGFAVEKQDVIFFKARNMDKLQFKAETITLRFDVVKG